MDRINFNYSNINLYKVSNESFYAIKPSFFVYFTGDKDTDWDPGPARVAVFVR